MRQFVWVIIFVIGLVWILLLNQGLKEALGFMLDPLPYLIRVGGTRFGRLRFQRILSIFVGWVCMRVFQPMLSILDIIWLLTHLVKGAMHLRRIWFICSEIILCLWQFRMLFSSLKEISCQQHISFIGLLTMLHLPIWLCL